MHGEKFIYRGWEIEELNGRYVMTPATEIPAQYHADTFDSLEAAQNEVDRIKKNKVHWPSRSKEEARR